MDIDYLCILSKFCTCKTFALVFSESKNKYFLILHAIDVLHSDIKLNKRKYTEQQKGLKWDFQLFFSLQFY